MLQYDYDFEYIGLRLSPDFFESLPDEVFAHIQNGNHVYADHITCLHRSQMGKDGSENVLINFIEDVIMHRNYLVYVKFTHIGISDKALALKAEFEVSCMNENPHCTIVTFNDGKPKDSNAITDWQPLENPITTQAMWCIQ